jgi:hypothetical protein
MFWVVMAITIVLFVAFAPRHLMNVFG